MGRSRAQQHREGEGAEEHRVRSFWFPVIWQGSQALTRASVGFLRPAVIWQGCSWACLGRGPLLGAIFLSFSRSSVVAQLCLPLPFLLPIFPKCLAWSPPPRSKSLGLERQPVFPFQLQDGRVECGSHTLLGCHMLGCQAVAYF